MSNAPSVPSSAAPTRPASPKRKFFNRKKKTQTAATTAKATLPAPSPPPAHDEIDGKVRAMLAAQGEKEEVCAKVLALSLPHKWLLLQSYDALEAIRDASRDARQDVGHWIATLRAAPHIEPLEDLSVLLRQKPRRWLAAFVEEGGALALCQLLRSLSQKQYKEPRDFVVMRLALGCVRTLMNQEVGMRAMTGLTPAAPASGPIASDTISYSSVEGDDANAPTLPLAAVAAESKLGDLLAVVLCADNKHESLEAQQVQMDALTLLSAAALYSIDGHASVLSALEQLRAKRRQLHRLGWLVELCARSSLSDAACSVRQRDPTLTDDAMGLGDVEEAGSIRASAFRRSSAGGSDGGRASTRVDLVVAVLTLLNALVGTPEVLCERAALRSELEQLELPRILGALRRERNADIQRQLEVYEEVVAADAAEEGGVEEEEAFYHERRVSSSFADTTVVNADVATAIAPGLCQLLAHAHRAGSTTADGDDLHRAMGAVLGSLASLPIGASGAAAWDFLRSLVDAVVSAAASASHVDDCRRRLAEAVYLASTPEHARIVAIAASPAFPKKAPREPTVPTRQFHWARMPDSKIKGTIWADDIDDSRAKLDVDELEKLFCQADAPQAHKDLRPGSSKTLVARPAAANLLEPKLSNNVAIAISRLKMTPDEIAAALLAGDEEAFSVDQLSGLYAAIPPVDEVEAVATYDGPMESLNRAELFLKKLSGVPRYATRLRCMLYRATFEEKSMGLLADADAVDEAAAQVRASPTLLRVLELTLAIGNHLNGKSARGAAWGFKLDSLAKLSDTKSADGKSTLLHYLARVLQQRDTAEMEEDVSAALYAEMPSLEAAGRVVWQELSSEVRSLRKGLDQIYEQVAMDDAQAFTVSMGGFANRAQCVVERIEAQQARADAACTSLKRWLGEDHKVQPEHLFSAHHAFLLSLRLAYRQNRERDEQERRRALLASQAAAAEVSRARRGNASYLPTHAAAHDELATKLARRARRVDARTASHDDATANDGFLVDSAERGMASGELIANRRYASFARFRSIRRTKVSTAEAAPEKHAASTRKSLVSADV